jgi:hypothetical protein
MPSGQYQRKLDKSLGAFANHNKLYEINMACRPDDSGIATRKLPVVPPHEALNEELVANPSSHQRVEDALQARELPPSYNSTVTEQRRAGSTPHPAPFYVDWVAYNQVDTTVVCGC